MVPEPGMEEGFTAQGMRGTLVNEIVPHLDCGGGYTVVYICQTHIITLKTVNFMVGNLYLCFQSCR